MNTALALVAAKALPALSGSSLTYNSEKNVYLTLGYLHGADRRQTSLLRSSGAVATGDASTSEVLRKRAFSC